MINLPPASADPDPRAASIHYTKTFRTGSQVDRGTNAVPSLSRKQIEAIFSDQTTDWSQVGGRPGHIDLFARDDRSGTCDTFKSLELESASLAPGTKRFEDSKALSG